MRVVKLNQSVDLNCGSVLTIGNFDGVHMGHQQLINTAVEQGQRLGLPVVLVTFSPIRTTTLGRRVPRVNCSACQRKY